MPRNIIINETIYSNTNEEMNIIQHNVYYVMDAFAKDAKATDLKSVCPNE